MRSIVKGSIPRTESGRGGFRIRAARNGESRCEGRTIRRDGLEVNPGMHRPAGLPVVSRTGPHGRGMTMSPSAGSPTVVVRPCRQSSAVRGRRPRRAGAPTHRGASGPGRAAAVPGRSCGGSPGPSCRPSAIPAGGAWRTGRPRAARTPWPGARTRSGRRVGPAP